MSKWTTRIAALAAIVALSLAAPGAALADAHEAADDHGPMPVAIVGAVFGGAMWLVSVPFALVFAPTHVLDSFDTMVAAPLRTTIGAD